jgi:TatD DNase family protein
MLELIDTHCHIQEANYELSGEGDGVRTKWFNAGKPDPDNMIESAMAVGVTHMICVGCTVEDSKLAVDFVQNRNETLASIGIHPHEADRYVTDIKSLDKFTQLVTKPKVVAIGECGLDYFYMHSDKKNQEKILRFQLEIAKEHNLPVIFHIREAFDDFWPIFDQYKVRGVVHSFSTNRQVLHNILDRGLYVGLNGIMTFTRDLEQLEAAKEIPLDKLVLETDAPFLTPAPYRGTICEPRHVSVTAGFLADLRGESLETFAQATTQNARRLFGF